MKILSKDVLRDMSKRERDVVIKKYVDLYYDKTKKGSKMPLPVLDFEGNNQEGRHRAMVAEKLGLKKMPVLIVEKCK